VAHLRRRFSGRLPGKALAHRSNARGILGLVIRTLGRLHRRSLTEGRYAPAPPRIQLTVKPRLVRKFRTCSTASVDTQNRPLIDT